MKGKRWMSLLMAVMMTVSFPAGVLAEELADLTSEPEFVGELPGEEELLADPESESYDDFQDEILLDEGELLIDGEDLIVSEEEAPLQEDLAEDGLFEDLIFEEDAAVEENLIEEDPDEEAAGDELDIVGAGAAGWVEINGGIYWRQEDGTILRDGGWQVLGGKRYFLANKSGRRLSGWVTYAGGQYYLDPETGVLQTGIVVIDKKWYYLAETGKTPGKMAKGFVTVKDKRYYAQDDGVLAVGWRTINGKKYHFGIDRAAEKNWIKLNGKYYFLDPNEYYARSGWLTRGSCVYYLKSGGEATVGARVIDGKTYFFKSPAGQMLRGWYNRDDGKKFYYGQDGAMLFGLQTIDGKLYYLNSKWGCVETGWKTISGKKYYFSADGSAVKEWQTIDGKTYFFDAKGYYIRTGWLTRGKNKYYLDNNGIRIVNFKKIDGKNYYFQPPYGIMFTGWYTKDNGAKYYYGTDGAQLFGIQKIGGKIYYLNPTYGYVEKGWRTVNGKRYFLRSDGTAATGLQTIGGKTYLFDDNGVLVTNKNAYVVNGSYYRIGADGTMTPITKRAEILACQRLDALGWNLQAAFNWASSLRYVTTPQTIPSGYTQAQYYGEYGFEHGYGDCYVMACVFYEMANMMGYNVRFLKGYVPSSSGSRSTHGWVEIYYNGGWYVCDPNFTYNTRRSGYMIYYGASGTWQYVDYSVVDQNY